MAKTTKKERRVVVCPFGPVGVPYHQVHVPVEEG
jgi:hypothetical protein